MADAQITPPNIAMVFRNKTQGSNTHPLGTPSNYTSIAAMKARLQTLAAGTYTNAVIRSMTVNDMTYALRMLDDPSSI